MGKRKIICREDTKLFVSYFANIFSIRTLGKRVKQPRCFQKERVWSAEFDVSKVLFQGIGKIIYCILGLRLFKDTIKPYFCHHHTLL